MSTDVPTCSVFVHWQLLVCSNSIAALEWLRQPANKLPSHLHTSVASGICSLMPLKSVFRRCVVCICSSWMRQLAVLNSVGVAATVCARCGTVLALSSSRLVLADSVIQCSNEFQPVRRVCGTFLTGLVYSTTRGKLSKSSSSNIIAWCNV